MDFVKRLIDEIHRRRRPDVLRGLEPEIRELITRIRAERLTYLSDLKLRSLVQTCQDIEMRAVKGVFIEAGCALGGSTILIATLKGKTRPFQVYDVFETIPAPSAEDTADVHERYREIISGHAQGIGGDPYYGYQADLYKTVQRNLLRFGLNTTKDNVILVKGMLQDTLSINEPVAFAHIDVDWYDPVRVCLQRMSQYLSVGGSLILDDYHDWGGSRKATDEFLRNTQIQFQVDDTAGSLKLTKIA